MTYFVFHSVRESIVPNKVLLNAQTAVPIAFIHLNPEVYSPVGVALATPTAFLCMAVTHTASANADVFDAVVVLWKNTLKENILSAH